MMSPPMAADDVSADAEMMLFAIAHNDAMFALMCPQAHIIAAGSIMCEARIICPTGQTSLKKSTCECRVFLRTVNETRTTEHLQGKRNTEITVM